jgi:hypothetical protein
MDTVKRDRLWRTAFALETAQSVISLPVPARTWQNPAPRGLPHPELASRHAFAEECEVRQDASLAKPFKGFMHSCLNAKIKKPPSLAALFRQFMHSSLNAKIKKLPSSAALFNKRR